jgi:hypothetical protein
MNNVTPFNDFIIESTLSTVSQFLKAQYNNIFQDPNQVLNNLFNDFTKRLDKEKNVSNLYQRFIKSNQITIQNEINKAESMDAVNKIVTDNIKYFYFSLKPVVNKLQNQDFTIETIFEKSRDKKLQTLMSYPEDQFSNAVQQYINDAVIPNIKKDAGLELTNTDQQQTQTNQPKTEGMMYNIYRILESDQPNQEEDIVKYKKSAINWFNTTLYELLKNKFTVLNSLGNNTGNSVDQLARQMKGTQNINAKKMIINKIVNMEKEELQKLADYLQIQKDELGQL